MLTLSELLAQKAALEKQILEVQREERAQAIAQIRELMSRYGLTLADVAGKPAVPAKPGAKVAPKYRDPATGATWSGRGLQPKWLKNALDAGRSLSEFTL